MAQGYQVSELSNKIRVITERMEHVKSVSFGIWVGVGSRHETEADCGASHFIEHMLFKGTKKRTAKDIAEEVDGLGSTLNAFTSKEYTCFYLKSLDENFKQTVDILADMFLNSKFAEEDIDKEREVIIEEIKMYEDTPDELANDLFSDLFWANHPLGRPILGTEDTLNAMDRASLLQYKTEHYTGDNIVISAAGNITHEEVLALAEEYFSQIPRGEKNTVVPFENYQGAIQCYKKDIGQVQICLGVPSCAALSDELYKVSLLNACFGGSMSSRLVQRIREEMGLAYAVFSYYSAYEECGILAVNVATRPENCQKVIDEILKEGKRIAEEGVEEWELKRAFGQFKSNTYLSMESSYNRMSHLGRNLLLLNRIVSPEEKLEKLASVTCEDIQNLAKKMFVTDKMVVCVLGMVDEIKVN